MAKILSWVIEVWNEDDEGNERDVIASKKEFEQIQNALDDFVDSDEIMGLVEELLNKKEDDSVGISVSVGIRKDSRK